MSKIRRERVSIAFDEIKIPEGHKVCPKCNGTGRYRFRYSSPSFNNIPYISDYMTCFQCNGSGFVSIKSDNLRSEKP